MSALATIRASVLMPLVHQIDENSGKADILLATHGILRSQLDDPYAVVPMARYVALFEDAALVTGIECLGARMGQMATPGDIGPAGVLFSLSPTISEAFDRLGRHVSSVQGGTSSGLYTDGDHQVWNYKVIDRRIWPRRQDSEFTMSTCCQLVRSCFSRNWRPLEVHFEHAGPRDTTALERIFRAPVVFGQSGNRMIFDSGDAVRVYRSEDRALLRVLERHIADLEDDEDEPETLSDQVRSLISIYLGYKRISLADVSAELGLSVRTLQRRLAEEGTSLRTLITEHRQVLAANQMGARMKKSEIALLLGYADATVFWRAREKWGHGKPGGDRRT